MLVRSFSLAFANACNDDAMSDDAVFSSGERGRDTAELLYRAVGLGLPAYTRSEVALLAGIDRSRSVKWWRAMGFPEVPEDVPAFADLDVEILRRLAALTGAGLVDDDNIMRLARLLGASFSRIADAQLTVLEQLAASLPGADPATSSRERIEALVSASDESLFDLLEDSLVYVWRRHMLAALGRRLAGDEGATERAIGFADLSGFTKLSQRTPAPRLAQVIDQFEETAVDVISDRDGRAVKFIGDETMFIAETLPGAVDIALDLADRLRAVKSMPAIHLWQDRTGTPKLRAQGDRRYPDRCGASEARVTSGDTRNSSHRAVSRAAHSGVETTAAFPRRHDCSSPWRPRSTSAGIGIQPAAPHSAEWSGPPSAARRSRRSCSRLE
jgi:adenylate cyclase